MATFDAAWSTFRASEKERTFRGLRIKYVNFVRGIPCTACTYLVHRRDVHARTLQCLEAAFASRHCLSSNKQSRPRFVGQCSRSQIVCDVPLGMSWMSESLGWFAMRDIRIPGFQSSPALH